MPTQQQYSIGKQQIFDNINQIRGAETIKSIDISFPGIIRGTEILQSSNIPDYYDRPLKADLESHYRVPVSIMQDSVCSAIAELVYGDIEGYRKIAYLIMGTGIGGSFYPKVARQCYGVAT